MELINKDKYKDLLWFRVDISYDAHNDLGMTKPLSAYFRFSIWRDITNATTGELQAILSDDNILLPNEKKEAIIVTLAGDLSNSFIAGEKLDWGGTQLKVGEIIINEILDSNQLEFISM